MEKTTTTGNRQGGKRRSAMVSEAACNNRGSRSWWTIYEDKVGHKCNYGINYDYIQLPPLLETNDLLSFGNEGEKVWRRFRISPRIEFRTSRGRVHLDLSKEKKKSKNKREINDSSSERTYGRVRFSSARKIKQGTGGRGGRTRILIKNNSHAGRSLPGPTHPPLLPPSAFRQLREREAFRSTTVDPIGNKDDPCTAPDAFAIFRNHRVSRYAY